MKATANTESQVRALLWEECRVGGSIAAVCAVVGSLLLLSQWYWIGVDSWRRDEFLAEFAALGMPVLTALLLILSPNNAGHLEGGFSKRVLRLPVATHTAVAASLAARTLLVYLVSLMLVGLSSALFVDAPGMGAALLIVILYVAAQLLDWSRVVLSGLSSLIALCALAMTGYALWPGLPELRLFERGLAFADRPWILPVASVAGSAVAYGVAALAVHAQRVGRRYGVPEIWEWPRRLEFSGVRRTTPFRSPMAAQVWFELRRAKWVLPITTVVGSLIIWAAAWLMRDVTKVNDGAATRYAAMWGVPLALLVGAAFHGLATRVIGFRRRVRTSGYEYLQPLTDAQFTNARVIAGALVLFPTLALVAVIHFASGGRWIVFQTLAGALDLGITSYREVAWIFLGRGLLVGILAWMLLMIGTRIFRRTLALVLAVACLMALSGPILRILLDLRAGGRFDIASSIVLGALTASTIGLAIRALMRSVITRRTFFFWFGAWVLVAWLFRYALVSMWGIEPMPWPQQMLVALTALGASAPVPLVFFATLLDVRRRRSTGRVSIDPTQHWSGTPSRGVGSAIAFVSVAIVVVWLGWPAAPAYVEYRRSKGYPATLSELNAWYPEPPAGANAATEYINVVNQVTSLNTKYEEDFTQIKRTFYPVQRHEDSGRAFSDSAVDAWEYVHFVGNAEWDDRGPLDRRAWNTTEFYWSRVTSKVVPRLQEIGLGDTSVARYPTDLGRGFEVELPHLLQLRSLARQTSLDALHWTVARKPEKAVDSIVAGIALSKSLANEPILISQLVRIAILGINCGSIKTLLNHSVPSDADLLRLQRACEEALPPISEGMFLDRSMITESAMNSSVTFAFGLAESIGHRPPATVRVLGPMLVFPAAVSGMGFSLETEAVLRASRLSWPEFERWGDARNDYYEATMFFSPLIAILSPAISRAYEAEWRQRTDLQVARAAVAVERFRLANNKLPAALSDLVPQFLSEVPEDHFAGPGVPLKYRVREGGEFVVYSVGPNMKDDLGEPVKKGSDYFNGDQFFSVAPMAFRTGPQVAAN